MKRASSKNTSPQDQFSRILQPTDPRWVHHYQGLRPFFQHWEKEKTLPHALLFSGPHGISKQAVIDVFVRWIFCEKSSFQSSAPTLDLFASPETNAEPEAKPPLDFPCGECAQCKKALSQQWVDFKLIQAEKSSDQTKTSRIKIDQLKVIQEALGHGPMDSPYRVFYIHQAEKMTPQAANSLLKVLEEPPKNWMIILSSSSESLLLPTIVSRCQRIRCKPYSNQVLFQILDQTLDNKSRIQQIVQRSYGNLKLALSMAEDEYWNQAKKVDSFLKNPKQEMGDFFDWCSKESDHLEFALSAFEAELHNQIEKNPKNFKSHQSFNAIHETRKLALTPVNRKLLTQQFLANFV